MGAIRIWETRLRNYGPTKLVSKTRKIVGRTELYVALFGENQVRPAHHAHHALRPISQRRCAGPISVRKEGSVNIIMKLKNICSSALL